MKNLRKLLAVILTVAFMATFSIPAFAAVPSDVVGTAYEDAVARLVALGIITGRPDGSYAPNDSVTRAEFATIIIRALGYGASVGNVKSQAKFSDVPSSYWAAGYINLAANLGIIKGRPDGTFGPNDTVLYEEAVTMIVRALGYEPAAATKGGYPGGYLVIADENDITDGFNGVIGLAANRGLVAQLVNESLEVPMMVQVVYGSETRYVVSGAKGTDTDEVKLIDKIGLGTVEGKVLSVDTDDREIEIKKLEDGNLTDKVKYNVYEGIELDGSLENLYVKVWTKDNTVYNLSNETDVYYDFIEKVDGEDNSSDLGGKDIDAATEIEIKSGDEFDVNDFVEDLYVKIDGAEKDIENDDAADLLDKFAKIYVKDDVAYRIEAYSLSDGRGLITNVSESEIEFVKGASEGKKIRDLDDAESLLVVIDGEVASLEDLVPNMYFGYQEFANDEYVIVAISDTIEGTLDGVKTDKISIDDEYTDLASTFYVSGDEGDTYDVGDEDSLADLLDLGVVAYLDFDGKITYVSGAAEEDTSDFYGVAMKAYYSGGDMIIKVYREVEGEGKSVAYTVDEDLDTDFETIADLDGSGPDTGTAGTANGIYKFTINKDGVITGIEGITNWAQYTAGTDTIIDFDEDNDRIRVNTDTDEDYEAIFSVGSSVFFNLYDGTDFDPELVKWEDIESKKVTSGVAMKLEDNAKNKPSVVVFTAGFESLGVEADKIGLLVEKVRKTTDDYKVKVDTGDEEGLEFLVDKGDLTGIDENDLIIYSESDSSRINIVSSKEITTELSVDTVYDVDGDLIELGADDQWYQVASDCLVYEITLDSSNEIDEIERSDVNEIAEGDTAYYYLDDDIIKAIFYVKN